MEKFFRLEFKPPFDMDIRKNLIPKRETDCPALPVCLAFGNVYESCRTHGPSVTLQEVNKCIPTIILLLGKKEGLWPSGMMDQIQARIQKIGFALAESGKDPSQKGENG